MTEKLNDVTAHAEMICFTSAANYMNSKYLKDCTLYATLGALCDVCRSLFLTQIPRIVYGAFQMKNAATRQ
ncbi:MAG: deaminase [Bacteroidia bacterium]